MTSEEETDEMNPDEEEEDSNGSDHPVRYLVTALLCSTFLSLVSEKSFEKLPRQKQETVKKFKFLIT
jgi:hypothetical protein